MEKNDGRFKKGRVEDPEIRKKRLRSIKQARRRQPDYHGMRNTKFFNSWRSMVTRCRGTCGPRKDYRDKGITVCEKWQKFKGFYEDMYPSYKEGLTIDRIKNELGYFKENCRWATHYQQAENKTTTRRVEYNGFNLTLRQWSEKLGISLKAIRGRYFSKYIRGLITTEQLFHEVRRRI